MLGLVGEDGAGLGDEFQDSWLGQPQPVPNLAALHLHWIPPQHAQPEMILMKIHGQNAMRSH